MLKASFTDSKFDLDRCPSKLVPGIYELGRPLLKFEDMRMSRTQVQLNVWPERIGVTRKGKNLSCLVRAGKVTQLELDTEYELKEGDVLYLLVSLYALKIEADSSPALQSHPSSSSISTEKLADTAQNGKKRSRDDLNVAAVATPSEANSMDTPAEDEDSDDDGVILLAKKPKLKEVEEVKVVAAPTASGHWSTGLNAYLKDPSLHPDVVVSFNEECVVIKDKYPKGLLHLLVMPRQNLPNLAHLKPEHIPLLTNLKNLATQLASQWMAREAETNVVKMNPAPGLQTKAVNIGFHAAPSMSQLHIHIISDDFDSPALKTKKHWNSFTTDFFIPVEAVLDTLQAGKPVHFDKATYDAYLEGPMLCHKCKAVQKNIPTLKDHISGCSGC